MSKRNQRAEQAQETLLILRAGVYTNLAGERVRIMEELEYARSQTRVFAPHVILDAASAATAEERPATVIEVTPESTLEAARRLDAEVRDCDPCCLNFASAKNPGGGFLGGASAQEESLARSSGLYACIASRREVYDYNRSRSTCLYSDYMIYSPRVPVFRDDEGNLLDAPYLASFITAPAVNAGATHRNEEHLIEPTMRRRAERVLQLAHRQGHRKLILGAWGCGVFRNDPAMVADIFGELLSAGGAFHNVFEQVVFAVLASRAGDASFEAFRSRFDAGS